MKKNPEYCVYYDKDSEDILDFFPSNIDTDLKNTIIAVWKQDIPRKILKTISEGDTTMQELRKKIGHSNSTLHENIKKLEELELIKTNLIYKGNKIRCLSPRLLFVTKNPKFKATIQKFFQGLWVDTEANKKVVNFLQDNKESYYTTEEIATRTGMPVDAVELTLNNWESQVTRSLSDFMKKKPFEKKVLYRGIK